MPPLLTAALIVFLEGLSFGVILPVLTEYAGELGGGVHIAGVLFALSTLPRAVFGPLWGRLSDRLGRRPCLAMVSVGTLAASLLWALAVRLDGFAFSALAWLLISRAVYGIFASQSGLTLAVASDVSTPAKRAAAMGAVGAAFGLAFTIGPALGGWFAHTIGERYGDPVVGHAAIGYLAGAFQVLSILVIATLLRETRPVRAVAVGAAAGEPTEGSELAGAVKPSSIARLITLPRVALLMLVTLLATVAYSVMLPTFQPLAAEWYGWNLQQVGYGLATFGLVGAFVQGGLIRPTVKRIGERATAALGLILLAAGLAWIGTHPATAAPGLWAAIALMALGTGFASPAITSLMSLSVGEHDQGAIHGLNYSATSLGRGSGYLIGSFVFQFVSPHWAYYAGAAAATLAMLLIVPLPRRRPAG